jgi:hypothetical protein
MKLLYIIATALALAVTSTTTMAEPKKLSSSNKATHHRVKSSQPSIRVPTYEDRLREYYELKRQGWYKEDKA